MHTGSYAEIEMWRWAVHKGDETTRDEPALTEEGTTLEQTVRISTIASRERMRVRRRPMEADGLFSMIWSESLRWWWWGVLPHAHRNM